MSNITNLSGDGSGESAIERLINRLNAVIDEEVGGAMKVCTIVGALEFIKHGMIQESMEAKE